MERLIGLVALVLSVAAWPASAADMSPAPDAHTNPAVAWQRALLPGAGAAWNLQQHHSTRGKGKLVRSRSKSDYLHPQECPVEADVAAGPDASTVAILAQLPAAAEKQARVSKETPKPPRPEPSASTPASTLVASNPTAAPSPVPHASGTVVASPSTAVPSTPVAPSTPVVVADRESVQPSAIVEANPDPTIDLGMTRLDIKEPDRGLARGFMSLKLTSAAALVVDQQEGNLLFAKNPDAVRSIASITKLMTAMVAFDAGQSLDERVTVQAADVRIAKGKPSRLKVGVTLTRRELFKLALMSSENRAAAALARTYPGGVPAFVEAMNRKADALGMTDTRFLEPTGLDSGNVSTAHDLAVMVNAAYAYPLIRESTTSDLHEVPAPDRRHHRMAVTYRNSNTLVRDGDWEVGLSKTGYIGKAGRCLVMQATIAAKPVIIVLLDSLGKVARVADANRLKHWLERPEVTMAAGRSKPQM